MRSVIAAATVAALIIPAVAQQPRPAAPPQRAPQAAQSQQPPAPPPGMFPCRTAAEVCHIGIITGPTQIMVLYSSAPQGQAAEGKPAAVQGADLAPNLGRVVMLTGELGPNGITGAQVVDVASPLVSFLMKQGAAADEAPPAPKGQPQRPAPRR